MWRAVRTWRAVQTWLRAVRLSGSGPKRPAEGPETDWLKRRPADSPPLFLFVRPVLPTARARREAEAAAIRSLELPNVRVEAETRGEAVAEALRAAARQEILSPRRNASLPEWRVRLNATKRQGGWNPKKKLSREQMEQVRALAESPEMTMGRLANMYKVSWEDIRRILKSRWQPTSGELVQLARRKEVREQHRRTARKQAQQQARAADGGSTVVVVRRQKR